MDTLVELYDKEPLENVLAGCIFCPKRVVYLCDERDSSLRKERAVGRLFQSRGLHVETRFYYMNTADPAAIEHVLLAVARDYPGCVFDFTGGRDLVLLIAGLVCREKRLPGFYIDARRGRFVNLGGCDALAREAGIFCDVRTSVVVEWTVSEEKGTPPTRNEIDVMCVAGTMPVFISCKMASPSPLALSEIEVLCRRFGGEAARAVVVTAAEPRRDSPAIYQRSKDLGITLIGGDVLRTGKLAQCLRRAAK